MLCAKGPNIDLDHTGMINRGGLGHHAVALQTVGAFGLCDPRR